MTMRALAFALALALAMPPAMASTPKKSATPNRFGAIAWHRPTQSWGVAYDHARARDAHVQALQQCGQPQCEIVQKFRNGCAALADGPRVSFAASGATRAEAEARTLRRCREQNRNQECTAIAWACTR